MHALSGTPSRSSTLPDLAGRARRLGVPTTTRTVSTTGVVVHAHSASSSVIAAWNSSSRSPVGFVRTMSTTPNDVRPHGDRDLLGPQPPLQQQDAPGARCSRTGRGEHSDTIVGRHRDVRQDHRDRIAGRLQLAEPLPPGTGAGHQLDAIVAVVASELALHPSPRRVVGEDHQDDRHHGSRLARADDPPGQAPFVRCSALEQEAQAGGAGVPGVDDGGAGDEIVERPPIAAEHDQGKPKQNSRKLNGRARRGARRADASRSLPSARTARIPTTAIPNVRPDGREGVGAVQERPDGERTIGDDRSVGEVNRRGRAATDRTYSTTVPPSANSVDDRRRCRGRRRRRASLPRRSGPAGPELLADERYVGRSLRSLAASSSGGPPGPPTDRGAGCDRPSGGRTRRDRRPGCARRRRSGPSPPNRSGRSARRARSAR